MADFAPHKDHWIDVARKAIAEARGMTTTDRSAHNESHDKPAEESA